MMMCPFISHMLGGENSAILTIDSAKLKKALKAKKSAPSEEEEIVILGYDDNGKAKTSSKKTTAAAFESRAHSDLYCLEDSCRFFQKETGECAFDQIYSMMKKAAEQKKESPTDLDKTFSKIKKELDKFWKFQTKSIAELIGHIGDSDKRQQEDLEIFGNGLNERLEHFLTEKRSELSLDGGNQLSDLAKQIQELQGQMQQREESIENFSATLSELVVNLDKFLEDFNARTERLSYKIEKIQTSVPDKGTISKAVQEAVSRKMDSSMTAQDDSQTETTKQMLESILQLNRELEFKLSKWQPDMNRNLNIITEKHVDWERRLNDLVNHQDEMLAFFKADKNRRDEEWRRSNKKEARVFNNLGVTSFHSGALEKAKEQFSRALELDPEFAEVYNNLGLVYTESGEESKATEAFEKATALNPDMAAAYSNLGYLFHKRGRYERAIEMYNEALGRSANSSSAYTNLGNAYFKLGKYEDARKAWEKALEIDPSNEKASLFLKRLQTEKL
jgi:TolA-binding protein